MRRLTAAAVGALVAAAASAGFAQGAYPARANTLAGHPSCVGYTVDNYKERLAANSDGPDAQLHSLCAGAYNYYWMYLNAIRKGFSQADSDRTYAAFEKATLVVKTFWDDTR